MSWRTSSGRENVTSARSTRGSSGPPRRPYAWTARTSNEPRAPASYSCCKYTSSFVASAFSVSVGAMAAKTTRADGSAARMRSLAPRNRLDLLPGQLLADPADAGGLQKFETSLALVRLDFLLEEHVHAHPRRPVSGRRRSGRRGQRHPAMAQVDAERVQRPRAEQAD